MKSFSEKFLPYFLGGVFLVSFLSMTQCTEKGSNQLQ